MRSTLQHAAPFLPIAQTVFIGLSVLPNFSYAAAPSVVHDFGTASVSSTGASVTLNFSLSGLTSIPNTSLGGVDYSVTPLTCNPSITTCAATVTFAPLSAGLRQDALILTNANGNPLASAFLHGIGAAPVLRAFPATISTLAGSGAWNFANGSASVAGFRNPQGLAADLHGNIYVADTLNQLIREITPAGVVSTFAGNGNPGYSGDGGPALSAMLNSPTGLAIDAAGNLFIADQGNSLIRRVDALTGFITTVAGGGQSSANGVLATTAALYGPGAVAVDTADNIYIADSFHNLIRQVSAATGLITTIAGGGTNAGTDKIGDTGPATQAELNNPTGIALDSSGNLYISDTGHAMVRFVNAATGVITVLAGSGVYGNAGDGGLADNAKLGAPAGLRLDANNNVYIADAAAQVVRFVNAATGLISTLAGNGTAGYSKDGGGSTLASLNTPTDVLLTTAGNLLIADYSNNVIRQVTFVPAAITFPSTSVTLLSAPVQVTLANYGNAALSLSNLALTAGFVQQSAGCSSSSSLAPGAACVLNLIFAPTGAGPVTGTLTVHSNDANRSSSQSTIALAGTGISGVPTVSLSPASLTFASQTVGTVSARQTLTLTNNGSAALSISAIQIAGQNAPDFVLANQTCQTTLAAASSCTVTVAFSPILAGARTATLNFTDSAANSPQIATFTGTGAGGALPVLSTTSLQFGSQPVSTAASARTVTLANSGVATLNIFGISLSGPDSIDFSFNSSTCGTTLAAGSSCTVSIGFNPSAPGIRTAALLWALSAGNSPQTVLLSGTGIGQSCISSISPASPVYLAAGASDSLSITAPSTCSWTAASSAAWIVITGPASGAGSATLSYTVSPNITAQPQTGTITVGNQTENITQTGVGLRFIPITPCRIVDTRNAPGSFGGPSLVANGSRQFNIPNSACGIPLTAQAYALNVTVVPNGLLSYITVWPTGQSQPLVSTLNSDDGRVKANAAIVPAGAEGAISVFATNTTGLVLDINGYFVDASDPSALAFYTLPPCRVADTRTLTGSLGQTYLVAGSTRIFNISGTCGVPSTAQAYSLNFTVVPRGASLSYLSIWPSDQSQPVVSTLNDPTGTVVANAALVRGSTSGSISAFATDATDLIIDIDGYFGPPAGSAALSLYNLTPCRTFDTRNYNGGLPFSGAVTPPITPCPVPAIAQSYVLNATVIPNPFLSYLSLWPAGTPQPVVSTLNAFDGAVTSNMAIVPLTSDLLSAYASASTQLVLDLSAFFAP